MTDDDLAPIQRLPLPSGHVIEVQARAEGERLQIRAGSGEIVVTVELTARGPVLRLAAAALEVSTGDLSVECDRLRLRARGGAALEIGGKAAISAAEVAVEARTGGLALTANDDVDVKGERVRLNSEDPPMPLTWEEHAARIQRPG